MPSAGRKNIIHQRVASCLPWFLLAIFLLAGMAGCQHGPARKEPLETEIAETVVWDNMRTVSRHAVDPLPMETELGVYFVGQRTLNFYDFSSQTILSLCAQAGCTHSDPSCRAYLGENVQGFVAYGGMWYVLDAAESGDLYLVEISPSDSNRRIVYQWNRPENWQQDHNTSIVSHGAMYVSIVMSAMPPEEESFFRLERVDLESGVCTTVMQSSEELYYRFIGAGKDTIALYVTVFDEQPLSIEEYAQTHGETDRETYAQYYAQFVEQHQTREIRLYDKTMESYTVVTAEEGTPWLSGDPDLCDGTRFLFAAGETLYTCDFDTGAVEARVTAPALVNFFLLDEAIWYITSAGDGAHFYYYPLSSTSGEGVKLHNANSTGPMTFSLSGETADRFIGLHGSLGKCWILKEDMYQERYENAVSFGLG